MLARFALVAVVAFAAMGVSQAVAQTPTPSVKYVDTQTISIQNLQTGDRYRADVTFEITVDKLSGIVITSGKMVLKGGVTAVLPTLKGTLVTPDKSRITVTGYSTTTSGLPQDVVAVTVEILKPDQWKAAGKIARIVQVGGRVGQLSLSK